jgi:hypothetical protein
MKASQMRFSILRTFFAIALAVCPQIARGDCTLTSTGNVPLPDLGRGTYQGFMGGLYPDGSNVRPPMHDAAGLARASQILPLDALGQPALADGKIVLISIGMSHTTQEFSTFVPLADADPSKDWHLMIVDGAQSGQDAPIWADPNSIVWQNLDDRLAAQGVTPAQVQVAWLKQALKYPLLYYGTFPQSAQTLQMDIEQILRNAKARYPNLSIVYLSSRSYAYTEDPTSLNPEPVAYESGFAVQWVIADQINGTGNINYDPAKGQVVAPWVAWGPYLWADGVIPRSDGLTWLCSDVIDDFTHPSDTGKAKVASELLAFFKTDPTATPWFTTRKPPVDLQVTTGGTPLSGQSELNVQFSATATDPNGTVGSYAWTFDDGTFSYEQNPQKWFFTPGVYTAHLTVTDTAGQAATSAVPVIVGGTGPLLNVSTRGEIAAGDDVLIGGFIVGGTGSKTVMLRGIGPSLGLVGISNPLADPILEVHDSSGAIIASNDNWQTTQIGGVITVDQVAEILASTIAPTDPAEAAVIATLNPGAYTAIVRGADSRSGAGLVELYDLDQASTAKLSNISTRGLVQTQDDVLIGGFIVGGGDVSTVLVRALGPSLGSAGLSNALANPMLELHDGDGTVMQVNDNWGDTQQAAIELTGIAPSNPNEAAILQTLAPGNYTATVSGKDGTTGVGLVEVYNVQ